jgi:LssY C-terminus
VGTREQVAAAFLAAGWSEPRPASTRADFLSAWAVVRNSPYPNAPMSSLLLKDAPADMSWQKGFDDLAKRHHIRLWEQDETLDGQGVWAGAATRDVDYAYFRHGKPMTHQVARLIDAEREKIAADMAFTSCADAVDWVDRPGAPHVVKGATGDTMETDGRVLVVRLNHCGAPRRVGNILDADILPEHGGVFQRVMRRQIMCLRNDFLRTNIYWRSFEGARLLVTAMRHRQVADPDQAPRENFASRWFPDELNTIISYR